MTISHDPEGIVPKNPDSEIIPNNFEEEDEPEGWSSPLAWEQLLHAIKLKQCTPFLGAGAAAGVLPMGKTIAQDWARHYHYPFSDSDNLPRVAQFLTIMQGGLLPRYRIKTLFQDKLPDFENPNEPHRVVAELDLPIYITTNYDSFMTQALIRAGRDPVQECCQWHKAGSISPTKDKGTGSAIIPTPEKPVVFHLHGYLADEDSMVLTETDYLNFLINISENGKVIPTHIEPAFATNKAFLFIGYSLEDMSFKVLFRRFAQQIKSSPGDRHVAVQLPNVKGQTNKQKKNQLRYLQKLLSSMNVKVYWGRADQFTRKLRERWAAFK
ncbi:MAG TPA: SIR2 family protein [Pyrinomonadaceae bacterium]|jgi:hypothetical protein|nr:SIR2 family protein [Pyrinomonadaceae bacterium]